MRRRFTNRGNSNQFDYRKYMTVEALEDGVIVSFGSRDVEYSINGGQWKTLRKEFNSPLLNKGDFFSARCVVNKGTTFGHIIGNGKAVNLRGNIMSLLFGDDESNSLEGYDGVFMGTFAVLNVINIERGFLPATTLAKGCYNSMFSHCTSLTTAPELPATTLVNDCYLAMFNNCTSLVNAPELPATTLASSCYSSMFYNCTSLTTAPELPATTLASSCYNSMFQGCTNLTTAPELPATTLASSCYNSMFQGCTNLNHIKMLATDVSATTCMYNWVLGVAPTGTFIKHKDAVLPTGVSGIPEGWTVVNDEEESDLIAFSIESPNSEFPLLERQAEEGMTWEEWCNSEYNLMYEDEGQFFEILGEEVYHYDDGWYVCDGAFAVNKNDIIENGSVYTYK